MAHMTTPLKRRPNGEIALLVGMSPSGISRIRNGGRTPNWDTMRKVAKAFGWPLEAQAVAVDKGVYSVQFEQVVSSAPTPRQG